MVEKKIAYCIVEQGDKFGKGICVDSFHCGAPLERMTFDKLFHSGSKRELVRGQGADFL